MPNKPRVAVATVHTLAMMLAGLAVAWAVYRYLGLQFLRRAWFDLDAVWGVSLVVAGAAGIALAFLGGAVKSEVAIKIIAAYARYTGARG